MLIRGKIRKQNSDSVAMIEEVKAVVRERGGDATAVARRYLLQHRWQRSSLAQPAPSGHGSVLADQQVVRARQAYWHNVRRILDRRL